MPPKKRADQPPSAALPANPERRLREAKPLRKSARAKVVVPSQELLSAIRRSQNEGKVKFSLAKVTDVGFSRMSKALNSDSTEKYALLLGAQIALRLREDDLVSSIGNGTYVIYLPETAAKEAAMVLERLCKQVCDPNNNSNLGNQQANLIFKTTTLNTSKKTVEEVSNLLSAIDLSLDSNESLQIAALNGPKALPEGAISLWAKRYEIKEPFWTDANIDRAEAHDTWLKAEQDNAKILLKKYVFKESDESSNRINSLLSQIQQLKIALIPDIVDYIIWKNSVFIAIKGAENERILQSDESAKLSEKQGVEFCSRACDLLVFLNSISPPIAMPDFRQFSFLINESEQLTGLEKIEDYLLIEVQQVRVKDDCQIAVSKQTAFESIIQIVNAIKNGKSAEITERFEETIEIFASYSQSAKFESVVSKAKASLKRHAENIKRDHLLSKSNPEKI